MILREKRVNIFIIQKGNVGRKGLEPLPGLRQMLLQSISITLLTPSYG